MAVGDIKYLSPENRRVINEIIRGSYRSGLKGRARRKARNTALAVGYTESRYRNLPGGDRDSQGWRQERKMYYKNPQNLRASVDRFYEEYKADANKKAPLGVRAQQVQQSGTPHVWDTLAPLAKRLAARFDTGPGGDIGRGTQGRASKPGKTSRPSYIEGRDTFDSKAFIIDNLIGKPVKGRLKNRTTSALLAELANPNSAYRTVTPSRLKAGSVEKSVGKLADKKSRARQDVRDILGPVAKDGWKGSKSVGKGLAKGTGLPSSSEKRSTVTTASGNVSDHYLGNKDSYAWDLSVSGALGTRKARWIARQLGVKNWQGGSWLNVTKTINGRTYRFQVGWNVPDHYDHIHLGVDRVDTPG